MADPATDVVVQIGGEDVLAGRLWAHRRRGAESATFVYVPEYLTRPDAYALDPGLPLAAGQHQTADGRPTFGAFSDCAPDRWGRRLITRAAKELASERGRAQRSFGEIDYLLGVRDDLRQGAMRFRDPDTGSYLADEHKGVPSLIDLPKLVNAADRLERDEAGEAELKALLRGGSSLGGARPKAHVLDDRGRIAIAKFPSPASDDWDVMRWEAVALELARAAGIHVADWTLHVIDGKPVLIVDRFDRAGSRRIGYVSAMTMLEAADRDPRSYVEIAEVVESYSPTAGKDLTELWRRVAFSILISNTDDHLRNHGFLHTSTAGWSLSPAFDLNPDPRPGPKYLSTAIDIGAANANVDKLLEVAPLFRLGEADALGALATAVEAVDQWRRVAARIGLGRTEIEGMAAAFEHDQAKRARDLAVGRSHASESLPSQV